MGTLPLQFATAEWSLSAASSEGEGPGPEGAFAYPPTPGGQGLPTPAGLAVGRP